MKKKKEGVNLNPDDAMKNKYLTFELGDDSYGVELFNVIEILSIQTITEMPDTIPCIKGVMNLRGKVIPVLDARIRFNKKDKDYNDRTCIIVIEVKSMLVGMIVDIVSEVIEVKEKDVLPPPNLGVIGRQYVKNILDVEERVVLIIDCNEMLNQDEIDNIKER